MLSRLLALALLLCSCSSPSVAELNAAKIGPPPEMDFAKRAILKLAAHETWEAGANVGHWPDAPIRGWFREQGEHRICWAVPAMVQTHNAWGVPVTTTIEFYFVDGGLHSWCPQGEPTLGMAIREHVWPLITPENIDTWIPEPHPGTVDKSPDF